MFRLNEINDFASFFTDVALAATDKLYFDGGSGTYVHELSDNVIEFRTDNNPQLKIDNSAGVIINDGSYSSFDFRVESNNNTHMLFVDSGNDRVGIGTSSPDAKLEVVDDNGIHLTAATAGRTLIIKPSPSGAVHEFGSDNTAAGYQFANNSGTLFKAAADGNFGINDNSPHVKLVARGTPGQSLLTAMHLSNQLTNSQDAIGRGVGFTMGKDDGVYSTKIATVFEGNNPSFLQPALAFYTMHNTFAAGSETEKMRISSSGNVGIGTTSPGAKFTVLKDGTQASSVSLTYQIQTVSDSNGGIAIQAGSSSIAYLVFGDNGDYDAGRIAYKNASHDLCFYTNNAEEMVLDSDGDLHVDRDVVAFSTTPSDKRLKTNIQDINYGLETIMKLSPKQYDWKKDDTHDIGFIAQEVEEVIPEIVKDKKHFDKEIKTLDYEKLTAVLIKAVQQQQEQINKLEEKLNG